MTGAIGRRYGPMANRLKIYCDAPSHAPREALIAEWGSFGKRGFLVAGDVTALIDDRLVSFDEAYTAAHEGKPGVKRERISLRCPLCGLTADLRREKAQDLYTKTLELRIPRLRLAALVAML